MHNWFDECIASKMTNSVVATLFDRSHTLKEKPEKIQKAYELWIAQQAPAVRHCHDGAQLASGLPRSTSLTGLLARFSRSRDCSLASSEVFKELF